MNGFFQPLVSLVVGWCLGLLSGPITDALTRRRERKRLTGAVRTELRELIDRATSTTLSILERRGGDQRPLLEWAIAKLSDSPREDTRRTVTNLRTLLAFPETQLQAASQQTAETRACAGVTSSIRSIVVPYLDSQIHRFDLLPPEAHQALLGLLTSVHFYNELIDQIPFFLEKTFDTSITGPNRDRIDQNIDRLQGRAAERARLIADEAELIVKTMLR